MEIEVRPHWRPEGPRWHPFLRIRPWPLLHPAGVEPLDDPTNPPLIPDAGFQKPDEPVPVYLVQESAEVRVLYPVDLSPFDPDRPRIPRVRHRSWGAEPVAEPEPLRLVDRSQQEVAQRLLDDLVLPRLDTERSWTPVRLG